MIDVFNSLKVYIHCQSVYDENNNFFFFIMQPHQVQREKLTGSQRQRGMYMNAGDKIMMFPFLM
jgi:hypothetical protein